MHFSQIEKTSTRWLICMVLSLFVGRAAIGAVEIPPEVTLFDFDATAATENAALAPRNWQSDRSDPVSRASHERVGADGNGALRFEYRLAVGRSVEVGVRLPLGSIDATQFDHLQLRLRGDESIGFAPKLKIAFMRPEKCDSLIQQSGSQTISGIEADWKVFRIPLNQMNGISDWTCLRELVLSQHARRVDQPHGAYWIDEVRLIDLGDPGPHAQDPVPTPRKRTWEIQNAIAERPGEALQGRLVGWPKTLTVEKDSLPRDDAAFMRRLAEDTWRGIRDLADREHGLPMNNIVFPQGTLAPHDTRIGDYANVTDIGLYLMSIVAAHELGLVDRDVALDMLQTTLDTLHRLERFEGFFYNYYDTTSLERSSHLISFVDSSWLTAGLIIVRNAFPEIAKTCTDLIEQGDYAFFYDPVYRLMSHGYYTNLRTYSEYHYGLLYTESRLGSLIAIGKEDVPAAHWYSMMRTLPGHELWQTLPPVKRLTKHIGAFEFTGGYYQMNGLQFVPSWGGSLFEALMPTLVVDETRWAPDSLGINNRIHAEFQRDFALETAGYPVWGMSPSAEPPGDRYAEFGVRLLGTRGYPPRIVTPHASALALDVIPDSAVQNLRVLVDLYPIYGDYGLYDAVDPISGEVARSYVFLDQAMTLVALSNHLTGGSIRHRFEQDPIGARGLPLLRHERFFD